MEWNVPFIIYRITQDGKVDEVFHAADLKMAKYWLTYIAQPGDVLCKTPLHPKHSKAKPNPEYWSHKEHSGTPSSEETAWKKHATRLHFDGDFPVEQLRVPENQSS